LIERLERSEDVELPGAALILERRQAGSELVSAGLKDGGDPVLSQCRVPLQEQRYGACHLRR